MHTQAGSLASLTDPSLTDVILALCASGHFGVREAIAAALRQEPRRMSPDSSDASTRRERDPESSASHPGFRLTPIGDLIINNQPFTTMSDSERRTKA
jgi:hypothetical protein